MGRKRILVEERRGSIVDTVLRLAGFISAVKELGRKKWLNVEYLDGKLEGLRKSYASARDSAIYHGIYVGHLPRTLRLRYNGR